MGYHFFTDQDKISSLQSADMAFGPMDSSNNLERYNLESKFQVTENAPAFAITKSMLIAVEDSDNNELLNVALMPVQGNRTAGFPIKFFIYRGLSKSSILDQNNNILLNDSSYSSDNILKVIKRLQDKFNASTGQSEVANSSVLGLQFGLNPTDSLEKHFFSRSDDFNPIIVSKGCEIGKFSGGSVNCGVQIVLDSIRYDMTISELQQNESIFEVQELNTVGLSPVELLKARFENRSTKEHVLNFIDITAFYGSCKNQGVNLSNVGENSNDFLTNFLNKHRLYIDIRDNWGYSHDHYFENEGDELLLGTYTSSNEISYSEISYYENWPILIIDDLSYESNKKFFFLKLPIIGALPNRANVLSAYNKKISVGKSKRSKRHINLEPFDGDDVDLGFSVALRCANWKYNDNKLGANIFLLKKNTVVTKDTSDYVLSPIWKSFFSLKMKTPFDNSNLSNGQLMVRTYSSLYAPLIRNKSGEELYIPTVGIAEDKENVTFFSYFSESGFREFKRQGIKLPIILKTGVYSLNESNYDFEDGQSVGFLQAVSHFARGRDSLLAKRKFLADGDTEDSKFIDFLSLSPSKIDTYLKNELYTITVSRQEYDEIVSASNETSTDVNIIDNHDRFIYSDRPRIKLYPKFRYLENSLGISSASIVGEGDDLKVQQEVWTDEVVVGQDNIAFGSIISHSS